LQASESDSLSVCINYDCRSQAQIRLSPSQWQGLARLFAQPSQYAAQERERIAQAIGLLEQMIGKLTGTAADQARNQATGEPGQLDCVAESRNTQAYLQALQAKGWLRFHRPQQRVRRAPMIIDTHWTAVIQESASGQRYAVDSWFRANGKAAVVMPLEDWYAKKEKD
jgi:hypothetical protein